MINSYSVENTNPTKLLWTRFVRNDPETYPPYGSFLYIAPTREYYVNELIPKDDVILGYFDNINVIMQFYVLKDWGVKEPIESDLVYLYSPLVFPPFPYIQYGHLLSGTYFKLEDVNAGDTIFLVSSQKDNVNNFKAVVALEDEGLKGSTPYTLGATIILPSHTRIKIIDNFNPMT